jgi:alpha-beta hydrolase superfamily lysophospholipase
VLCAPFSREYTQAYETLRLVAEQLAAHDVAVLRFDYDGMGDSAGDNSDPDRLRAWLRSTAAAIGFIRTAGMDRVSLVGMRIGATIAARAAADDGGIEQLVLWDPCLSGREFLRAQQVVSALTFGVTTKLPDGSIETPGLVYGPDAVADLRMLRLDALRGPVARRVLVLTRPDRHADPAVTATLGSESVEHEEADGQEALMDVPPPFQKRPCATIERVVDWVSKGSGDAVVPVRPVRQAGSATVGHDTVGRPIIERPVFVPPAGLFGILTEVPDCPADAPVALFLSVANEHHVGPGRLWVHLARRWATLGFRCLRLDLSGLGESPLRHPGQQRFAVLSPESFVDVADAVRAVAPDDPRRVVLVGMCSSAYQAIESAFHVSPGGVVAINPGFSFVPPEVQRGLAVDPRRRVALPKRAVTEAFRDSTAVSVLRRKFPGLRRRMRLLAQPDRRSALWLQALMGLGWRARLWAHPARRPSAWLPALTGSGADTLIVVGETESRPLRFGASQRVLDRLAGTARFHLEYIPDLEHTLLISTHRAMVSDLATDHVVDRFVRGVTPSPIDGQPGPADAAGGPARPAVPRLPERAA